MNNKLIDSVMTQMCDEYCKFPLDDFTDNEFDLEEKCSTCPLRLFLELLDNK